MTPQQIEAMKLALEALKKCRYRSLADEIVDPAIKAIEKALAQPEQEPVAWQFFHGGKWHNGMEFHDHRKHTIASGTPVRDLYTTPSQPERHELQAKGEHSAPCARFCEANAFKIVIKNLKAQLAQPEQEEKLPPVEIGVDVTDIGTTVVAFYRRPNAVMEMFYSQFHPLAQPEQEPVTHSVIAGAIFDFMGWLTSRKERIVLSSADNASPAVEAITEFAKMRNLSIDDAKVQDWNTTPPQRKPLTDEEIDQITEQLDETTIGWSTHEFSRAIEAAHGIKENT